MKIYISADIEGVTEITHWDEAIRDHPAYREFQERMTEEVIAACEGAQLAGATEIWVKDAHGSGRNVLAERLPHPTRLIRGWSGHPYGMVQELDQSFDFLVFVGYHSVAASGGHPLSHTYSGVFNRVELNGSPLSEFRINNYTGRLEGVPTVFISGDESLCSEAMALEPDIVAIATHKGMGHSTVGLHPSESRSRIQDGVKQAIIGGRDREVLRLPDRFTLKVRYRTHVGAYRASFYPGLELISDDTVQLETDEWFEVLRFMNFGRYFCYDDIPLPKK